MGNCSEPEKASFAWTDGKFGRLTRLRKELPQIAKGANCQMAEAGGVERAGLFNATNDAGSAKRGACQ